MSGLNTIGLAKDKENFTTNATRHLATLNKRTFMRNSHNLTEKSRDSLVMGSSLADPSNSKTPDNMIATMKNSNFVNKNHPSH